MALKTDYKDYKFPMGTNKRKYNQVNNGDGTISFEDVTQYEQIGDRVGAADLNNTNAEIVKLETTQIIKLPTLWQESNGKFIQTVDVVGMKVGDRPDINIELSADNTTADKEFEEYSKIFRVDSLEGQLKFTFNEKTTMPLNIMVKGV